MLGAHVFDGGLGLVSWNAGMRGQCDEVCMLKVKITVIDLQGHSLSGELWIQPGANKVIGQGECVTT